MSSALIQALNLFHPDAEALLGPLCHSITDEELQHIANWDSLSYDEHIHTLRAIKRSKTVPTAYWNREAVALACWWFPREFDWNLVADARQNPAPYRECLFAGATLLRFAQTDTQGMSMSENAFVATILASALALGGEQLPAVRQALAAFAQSPARPEERLCAALGALLAAAAQPDPLPGLHLRTVADAIIAETDRLTAEGLAKHTDWLLGLTSFRGSHPLWRSLAQHLLVNPRKPHPPEARDVLELMGSMLVTR